MVDPVDPIVTLVRGQLEQIARSPDHGLLTVGVLAAWTSSTALVSIVSTLNRAYGATESRPWWKVRLLAIASTKPTAHSAPPRSCCCGCI